MFGVFLEKSLSSSWDDEANAGKQQQGAARLVQHGVELLMLVLSSSQQETAACMQKQCPCEASRLSNTMIELCLSVMRPQHVLTWLNSQVQVTCSPEWYIFCCSLLSLV